MKHFAVLITLLRDRKKFLAEIRQNVKVERKITSLLIASSAFFAVYGAIIGASSSWQQVISSAIKLPALYLITLLICLPTLYFFDILFGSKLTFGQYAALILTTVSVISVLLFSFAPVTLFFLISIHEYTFFLLFNVAIFTITGLVGVKMFYEGMRSVTTAEDRFRLIDADFEVAPMDDFLPSSAAAKPASRLADGNAEDDGLQKTRTRLLQLWLVLYAMVGCQLGWTLRPFFGAPGETFHLFRNLEGNFYGQVWRSLLTLLGVQ
ncbi:MAG: actin-binding WH2 domain-containing protein [Leptolyngbyaceae cyanobacterium CSU_1_4]|nr:actin-binding WH2 domain-containing protein [Leptolyngbyaceae cyanobacterium CSU_1_4]